jgi:hypothetical protein
MKYLIGLGMGLASGFLLYLMTMFLWVQPENPAQISFLREAMVPLGGWAASTALLLYQSANVTQVLKKGFLLGASEWLFVILAGFIFSANGVVTLTLAGFCFFMTLICLAAYAITHFWTRETRPA